MPTMLTDTAESVLKPVRRQIAALPDTVIAPAKQVLDTVSTGVRSFGERLRQEPVRTVLPYAAAAVAIAVVFAAGAAIARRSR